MNSATRLTAPPSRSPDAKIPRPLRPLPVEAPTPGPLAGPASPAERILVALLSKMDRGSLRLECPDGRIHHFGQDRPGEQENRTGPHASLTVFHPGFFRRCLLHGDIGFAEGYLEGDWITGDLTAVLSWFLANVENNPTLSGGRRRFAPVNLLHFLNRITHRLRPNSLRTSRRNIREHYDLSNPFFAAFLDPGMTYSCALWPDAPGATLEQAQEAKYERLCRNLRLRPEDRLLEIGCGWGGFAQYAATRYRCRITAVTLSENQYVFAARRIQEAGLADRVTIELRDYRQIEGEFDKIASIEMLEAVGHRYLPAFAAACGRLLAPRGLLGLQFITCPDARYDSLRSGVDFIQKHVFPGSLLLSPNRLNRLLQENGNFHLHGHFDMAPHYARTLRAWRDRFERNLEEIRALGFDNFFLRKWRYYLCYCEAAFASRNISVVQTLHTRPNNPMLDLPPTRHG